MASGFRLGIVDADSGNLRLMPQWHDTEKSAKADALSTMGGRYTGPSSGWATRADYDKALAEWLIVPVTELRPQVPSNEYIEEIHLAGFQAARRNEGNRYSPGGENFVLFAEGMDMYYAREFQTES